MKSSVFRAAAVAFSAALALSACGGSDSDAGAADDGTLTIVASTNVYGDIAQAVAGDDVEVTSIIDSSAQDPHEYEATAQDRLTLDEADIVIENGGGYDPFIDSLLSGSDNDPHVITAVDVSGLLPDDEDHDHAEGEDHDHAEGEDHDHAEGEDHEGHDHIEGFNEHVWYDFHAVEHVADEVNAELAELDPDNASVYQGNYEELTAQIEDLEASADSIKATADGKEAAITEPVPLYLLEAAGLTNVTPEAFSEAVEEGADVPARVLAETLDLFSGGDVAVLAYNSQTEDATTQQVKDAAEAADVPVVDFTETLPDGMGYVDWMQANLDHLAEAVGGQ